MKCSDSHAVRCRIMSDNVKTAADKKLGVVKCSTMAFHTADLAPWIGIKDREILLPALLKSLVELALVFDGLDPGICGVSKEHAQKMSAAAVIGVSHTVGRTSVHNAQVVNVLDVASAAIEFRAELTSEVFDNLECICLLHRNRWHHVRPGDLGTAEQWGLDKLNDGLAVREENSRTILEIWEFLVATIFPSG